MLPFSKLFRDNREISLRVIRDGSAVLLSGQCPRCGRRLAWVMHYLPYLDPDWEFGDTPVIPLPCCVPVWPTDLALTVNGQMVMADSLARAVSSSPEALLGEVSWMLVLLDRAQR